MRIRTFKQIFAFVVTGLCAVAHAATSPGSTVTAQQLAALPLSFEENRGQADAAAKFLARTPGAHAFVLDDGVGLAVGRGHGIAVRMRIVGASKFAAFSGEEQLPGTVNYLRGARTDWKTNLATFAKVRCRNVLPNIDALYYGNGQRLEYDFILHAGADLKAVVLAMEGAESLAINEAGELEIAAEHGVLKQHAPVAYQVIGGHRRNVDVRYVIESHHERTVRFECGEYDRSHELVIDPIISFGTFLGGSDYDEANAIALDAAGNAYIAGTTVSPNLPTTWFPLSRSSFQLALEGENDAFVCKLNNNGTSILYTTYLGGTNRDEGRAIAVDAQGYVSVAGITFSKDFPVTTNAWRTTLYPCTGGFLTRLDPFGHSAVYSTFLTTSVPINDSLCFYAPINSILDPLASPNMISRYPLGGAGATSVAVDGQGNAYVAGYTARAIFDPVGVLRESPNLNNTGGFICKFSTNGVMQYSTYLGGVTNLFVNAIAVDTNGAAYLAGGTQSPDLPVSRWAAQPDFRGGTDGFVVKLDPSGYTISYATYLGGRESCDSRLLGTTNYIIATQFRGYDVANAIAVASNGVAWVAGSTRSPDFPVAGFPVQSTYADGTYESVGFFGVGMPAAEDAFVTALSVDGASFQYSTFLGGTNRDQACSIALANDGSVVIGGRTTSHAFPLAQAWQTQLRGTNDGFIARIHPITGLVYSSFLGGTGKDVVYGVAVDGNGMAFAAGQTESSNFPATGGVPNPTFLGGASDAFLVKIGTTWSLTSLSPSNTIVGSPFFLLAVNGTNFPNDAKVSFGTIEPPIVSSSSTQITVVIYSTNLLQAGTVSVNVVRPSGLQADNSLPFVIAPIPGDYFEVPLTLAGFTNTVSATNTYATREADEPQHAYQPGVHSLWWTWTAPASGTVVFTTTNSDFDTVLAVYTGNALWNLTPIAWNDDENAFLGIRTSKLQFNAIAGTIYRIAIDGWASAQGRIVLNFTMNQPAPTLTGIDHTSVLAGSSGFTLNVYGQNFVPASRVLIDAVPRATTFLSSTQLQTSVYTSDLLTPGNVFVGVFTTAPGGGTSATATVQVLPPPPAPVLVSLKPNTATVGSETMAAIANGSNFTADSVVKWNGSVRPTTFFSTKQLLFTVPATDMAGISTNSVTVYTPLPGGGISSAKPFYVTGTNGGSQTFSLKAVGYSTDGFKYQVNGETGSQIVIESTTNFTQWTPLTTNVLLASPAELIDADTNQSLRFIRGVATE